MSIESPRRAPLRLAIAAFVAVGLLAALWAGAAPARATVWLCKPGTKPDPCAPGLSTTVYNAPLTNALRVEHPKALRNPPIDCFYVYPTVSDETTANSDLRIQNTERSIAKYQVSRYSQYCKVYAPMYRQVTLAGLGLSLSGAATTGKSDPALAVRDVERAFADYLKHYNRGRGFVLIGHSQGAGILEALMAQKIDRRPAVRRRLISAILMGGNVLVKGNSGIGGDFKHIPACRRATQLGCVIAFSTFDQPAPSDSLFGRPIALPGEPAAPKGDQVLCSNPANLAGGSGVLTPIQPSAPFAPGSTIALAMSVLNWRVPSPPTVFWAAPRSYSARCEDSNGAHVLEISPLGGAQTPTPSPTPAWGLHLLDANLSLGNLISIVKSQSAAYLRRGKK